ncbi:MAG TPA: von Willebrand factor type A domain-containing protein [Steroidobacteraceae bacterium]|nr:von Willebrand factor type A domain-containing protein [Steroidobacteraceae bacterium]
MKDQGIENYLENLATPAPDPEARERAKRAALAEFARAQAADNILAFPRQESSDETRLSRESTSYGSASMKRFANRGWYAAAAGIGVLGLGLIWALPNFRKYGQELSHTELPATAQLPERPADAAAGASAPEGARAPEDHDSSSSPAEPLAEPPLPEPPPPELESQPPANATRHFAGDDQGAVDAGRRDAANEAARRRDESGQSEVDARALADSRQRESKSLGALADQAARAPVAPAPPPPQQPAANKGTGSITVTGMRRELEKSKRDKSEAAPVDAITAEDVGQFPDSHIAESLQRIPGVQIAKDEGRDRFEHFEINPVHRVADAPVSTFSADVDTASYSFVRARINEGSLPQNDAVRAEEMINYFDYAWPAASSRETPFEPTVVVGDSPWGKGRKLVHIGIKGYEVDRNEVPDANLVLLLDVSGSMNEPNKLPLVIRSMELLLGSLKPADTVGIVVYAGAAGTVLEPTPVREKDRILEALRSLRPGGSTAGAEGIERAYQLAEAHFRKGGVNRILLCTDGDFNVGIDSTQALKSFVERKREKGVYLSVLGFGQGNYRDELAQALAQNGNGVAAYIDTDKEAQKVLVQEATASLFTIAKDVKLQVEFNPATVSEYRLVGYETRSLEREDFNNDAVDAGDVGAGHTVTAIYEITPAGVTGSVDEPRYEQNRDKDAAKRAAGSRGGRDEYGFLKIRYKLPGERTSRLISEPIPLRTGTQTANVRRDVEFSTAVAGFAQLLSGGKYTGSLTYGDVLEQAQSARGEDRFGYRSEFIDLVRRAQKLGE